MLHKVDLPLLKLAPLPEFFIPSCFAASSSISSSLIVPSSSTFPFVEPYPDPKIEVLFGMVLTDLLHLVNNSPRTSSLDGSPLVADEVLKSVQIWMIMSNGRF